MRFSPESTATHWDEMTFADSNVTSAKPEKGERSESLAFSPASRVVFSRRARISAAGSSSDAAFASVFPAVL